MIYSTPPADFDGVTVSLRLIEQAMEYLAFARDRPPRERECLQAAAHLVKEAWLALQTMAGRLQREEEERKRQAGREQCLLCRQWKPLEMMVKERAGYGGEDEERTNHWFRCRSCEEPAPDPERDPFEEEE